MEVILLATSIKLYKDTHEELNVRNPGYGRLREHMTQWEVAEVLTAVARITVLLALSGFYLISAVSRNAKNREAQAASNVEASAESSSLLPDAGSQNGTANGQASGYGTAATGGKHKHTEGAPPGWERPTSTPSRSWWEYLKGYTLFFPYLWPTKDRKLQLALIMCFTIVILQRGINVLVPYEVGVITDILSGENGPVRMPWSSICLYIVYRVLQGNNGILGAIRSNLWIPISQYSYRELSVASFEHVHSLSLDFHLGKKTGEVLSALGKGSSINTFLESVTFQVVPMIIDLIVAIAYFLIAFDAYYALVVAVVTFWYIYLTIRMAQWRTEIRRQMVNADREEDAVK